MKKFLFLSLSLFVMSASFAQGDCSEADLLYMAENQDLVTQVATDCGTECLFAADPDACMLECMGASTELTDPCINCFSAQASCIIANCFAECALGIGDCNQCVLDNCVEPWQVCTGVVDLDGDGFTVLTDCNDNDAMINPDAIEIWYDGVDQNCDGLSDFDQDMDGEDAFEYGGLDCNDLDPLVTVGLQTWYIDMDGDNYGDDATAQMGCVAPPLGVANGGDCDESRNDVYPGALGTAEGVDNDCNGLVEADELLCQGDLNNDLQVDTADLLELLTQFACTEACSYDLDGDDAVNTSDLLAFLAQFGNICG